MATFALLPGAAAGPWYWHLVEEALRAEGHDTVAVDLPLERDDATFDTYADVAVEAIGDRAAGDLVVVAHSLGGFTGPLICERLPVDQLVLVTAMIPRPGEAAGSWWADVGHAEAQREQATAEGVPLDAELTEAHVFYNGVPEHLQAALEAEGRGQSGTPFADPWPLAAWPDVPTRFVVCTQDRFQPPALVRRLLAERLPLPEGAVAELPAGHLPMLSHPRELTDLLLRWWDGRPRQG